MEYKTTIKPGHWQVTLCSGEYDSYEETHLFIKANDRYECWGYLKEYWRQEYEKGETHYNPVLWLMQSALEDEIEETYIPGKPKNVYPYQFDEGWESSSGYGNRVFIQLLYVIEFRK